MLSTPVVVAVLAVVALLGLVVGIDLAYSFVQQRRLRRGQGAGPGEGPAPLTYGLAAREPGCVIPDLRNP